MFILKTHCILFCDVGIAVAGIRMAIWLLLLLVDQPWLTNNRFTIAGENKSPLLTPIDSIRFTIYSKQAHVFLSYLWPLRSILCQSTPPTHFAIHACVCLGQLQAASMIWLIHLYYAIPSSVHDHFKAKYQGPHQCSPLQASLPLMTDLYILYLATKGSSDSVQSINMRKSWIQFNSTLWLETQLNFYFIQWFNYCGPTQVERRKERHDWLLWTLGENNRLRTNMTSLLSYLLTLISRC